MTQSILPFLKQDPTTSKPARPDTSSEIEPRGQQPSFRDALESRHSNAQSRSDSESNPSAATSSKSRKQPDDNLQDRKDSETAAISQSEPGQHVLADKPQTSSSDLDTINVLTDVSVAFVPQTETSHEPADDLSAETSATVVDVIPEAAAATVAFPQSQGTNTETLSVPGTLRKHLQPVTNQKQTAQAPVETQSESNETPVPPSLRQALSSHNATESTEQAAAEQGADPAVLTDQMHQAGEELATTSNEASTSQLTLQSEAGDSQQQASDQQADANLLQQADDDQADTPESNSPAGNVAVPNSAEVTQHSAELVHSTRTTAEANADTTQALNVPPATGSNRQSQQSQPAEGQTPTDVPVQNNPYAPQSTPFAPARQTETIAADSRADSTDLSTEDVEPATTKSVQTPSEVYSQTGNTQSTTNETPTTPRVVATVDVNDPQLAQKLSELIENASNRSQMLRVRLNPQELGQVDITVQLKDGVLIARLEADTLRAQQLLQEHVASIKDTLSQQGLTVDRIEVTQNESQFSDPRGRDFEHSGNHSSDEQPRQFMGQTSDSEDEQQASTPQRVVRNRIVMSELDVEV